MATQRCIDAYGNERKDGHIRIDGHTECARCGSKFATGRTTER